MKNGTKPMNWLVKNFDCNRQIIKDYDVLARREDFIKKLKKKCDTKDEFAEALEREMMWSFWSKAEHELIIEIDGDGRIWLNPWVGCYEPEKVRIDVTDDDNFDWKGFADKHISAWFYKNQSKIDIYDQLMYKWDEFVDYCWEYRHKHQRIKNTTI